jgi:uncharacterized membrane protein
MKNIFNIPHFPDEVVNYEIIVDEVVRTLVGSIELVAAVSVTTFLESLTFIKRV